MQGFVTRGGPPFYNTKKGAPSGSHRIAGPENHNFSRLSNTWPHERGRAGRGAAERGRRARVDGADGAEGWGGKCTQFAILSRKNQGIFIILQRILLGLPGVPKIHKTYLSKKTAESCLLSVFYVRNPYGFRRAFFRFLGTPETGLLKLTFGVPAKQAKQASKASKQSAQRKQRAGGIASSWTLRFEAKPLYCSMRREVRVGVMRIALHAPRFTVDPTPPHPTPPHPTPPHPIP